MPYVAVKGGEQAIRNAEALLKAKRRGDVNVPELSLEQIKQQLQLAVNRVMAEGSLYEVCYTLLVNRDLLLPCTYL